MLHTKILVVGYPNVGKSSIIRRLTGVALPIGNFHGTTIGKDEVSLKLESAICTIIDIPGISSMDPSSEASRVAIDAIQNNDFDMILNVLDGTKLHRDIHLTEMLISATSKPIIVAINMLDEMRDNNLYINTSTLSKLLDTQCTLLSAKLGIGFKKLSSLINEIALHGRSRNKKSIDINNVLKKSVGVKKINKKSIHDLLDVIIMQPSSGIPILISIMSIMFYSIFAINGLTGTFIEQIGAYISIFVSKIISNPIISLAITDGIVPAIFTTLSFLPGIMTMLLYTGIIDKSGYMDRISYMLDRTLKAFGMDGKSIIAITTGLSCSLLAYMITRTIENRSKRIATMFAISVLPCNAKMIVLLLLAGTFFQGNEALAMSLIYFASIVVALVMAMIASKISQSGIEQEHDSFIAELSRYRMPQIRIVLHDLIIRIKVFLKNAGTMIAMMSLAIWVLSHIPYKISEYSQYHSIMTELASSDSDSEENIDRYKLQKEYLLSNSVLGFASKIVEPIFKPIGFDWKLTTALCAALAAKEVAIGTLEVLYPDTIVNETLATRLKKSISLPSGVSFITFIMLYLPCLSAVTVFHTELKSRAATSSLIIVTMIFAWIMSLLSYHITGLLIS